MNTLAPYRIPLLWTALVSMLLLIIILVLSSSSTLTYVRNNVSAIVAITNSSSSNSDISTSTATITVPPVPSVPLVSYIEVIDSCNWEYIGDCVNMRSAPTIDSSVVLRLRKGIVLRVKDTVLVDGQTWYKIAVDPYILHPERVTNDWYVSAATVQLVSNEGDQVLAAQEHPTTTKRILVDISQEMLYAYDGTTLFMKEAISTGLDSSPTPSGTYEVFKKTPSRYMQGPTPGTEGQSFDLPGVPWDLYFTSVGDVIHGAYWHNSFGRQWSHGCVNLPTDKSKELYDWAPIGITVTVRD